MEHALIPPQLALAPHQHEMLKPKIDSGNDEKVTVVEFKIGLKDSDLEL